MTDEDSSFRYGLAMGAIFVAAIVLPVLGKLFLGMSLGQVLLANAMYALGGAYGWAYAESRRARLARLATELAEEHEKFVGHVERLKEALGCANEKERDIRSVDDSKNEGPGQPRGRP